MTTTLFHLTSSIATLIFLVIAGTPVSAETVNANSEVETKIHILEEQITQLKQQVDNQFNKIDGAEKSAWENKQDSKTDYPSKTQSSQLHNIEISGLVEAEASITDRFDNQRASDLTLATMELGIDAAIYEDWITAHLLALHEDDDTEPWEIDEGIITIGNVNYYPWYMAAGRMVVSFGNFASHMISDPLTLEIGETREAALQLGVDYAGFYGSVFTFNGETNTGDDDEIEHFGINLGISKDFDRLSLDIGLGYMNNNADSDTIQDYLAGATGSQLIANNIAVWGAYGIVHFDHFTAIGEYLSDSDRFASAELPFNGHGAKLEAWNLEIGYHFEFSKKKSTLAIGYQGTNQALSLSLPKNRFLTTLSVGIADKTTLSLEWAHDWDYDTSDTGIDAEGNPVQGTGNNADTITAQLAVEFWTTP